MKYRFFNADPNELELGGLFEDCGYAWKPYEKRDPDHRADYDRLVLSMYHSGAMTNPLICYRGHVLIGQRRCEIARRMGWRSVPCVEIENPHPDHALKAEEEVYEDVSY